MAGFAQQVKAFGNRASSDMVLVVRKIALEMFQRVILRSPVDTGRFRGNWQVRVGGVATGTLQLDDPSGAAAVSSAQAAALGLQPGQSISLVNNLPYAQRLENGYSAQAPAGMVSLTVQDFQQIVRKMGLELVRK